MNHPYLSKADIESLAQKVVSRYKSVMVPDKHLCYTVEPESFASVLGISIDYQILSAKGSYLGVTSPSETCITILDDDRNEVMYFLDGNTILVEKRLTGSPRLVGRKNFTIAHEIAHQILYRTYPELYGVERRLLCDYRRSSQSHRAVTDWGEWQADTLAAAILLPEDAVRDAMFIFDLGEKMTVLSRKYSPNRYDSFCRMAEFLGVSRSTLSFRMEQLGLLERNNLITEAQRRNAQ